MIVAAPQWYQLGLFTMLSAGLLMEVWTPERQTLWSTLLQVKVGEVTTNDLVSIDVRVMFFWSLECVKQRDRWSSGSIFRVTLGHEAKCFYNLIQCVLKSKIWWTTTLTQTLICTCWQFMTFGEHILTAKPRETSTTQVCNACQYTLSACWE